MYVKEKAMVITDLLEKNARLYGSEISLVEINPSEERDQAVTWRDYSLIESNRPDAPYRREMTWSQFDKNANRFANLLLSRRVKKGTKVGILLMNCLEWLPIYFGILKAGCLAVPLNFRYTSEEIQYCLGLADVEVLVFGPEFVSRLDPIIDQIPKVHTRFYLGKDLPAYGEPLWELMGYCSREAPPVSFTEDDLAAIYFSSGTTGFPKMAIHDQLYPLGHIATARYWHTNKPGGLHFTISDTGWAKAGWGKIYGQWLCECAVFAYDFDRFDPVKILEMLQTYRISTFCAPPTMYRMLTQNNLAAQYDLTAITHCCSAGEPLNPEVFQDWKAQTGLSIHEGFGQSETTCCLATFPGMELRFGAMGKPVPGYDIQLLDEDGKPVQPGQEGEICIRVDGRKPLGLFLGYYRDDLATARAWHDGFYHTGDVATMDAAGYFWYVGRKDDLIKSSGYRIGPFEVESALLEHEAVLEAAITGVPDLIRGQVVKATIVLKDGYIASDALKKELQNHVKRTTAPYKYPRLINFTDALPKTASGKIRRVALR